MSGGIRVKKSHRGVAGMAQWINPQLHKCEECSLGAQLPCKSQAGVVATWSSSTLRAATGSAQDKLASWMNWNR